MTFRMPLIPDSVDDVLEQLVFRASSVIGRSCDSLQVQPLCGDGSDRKFFRISRGRDRFVALWSERRVAIGMDENDSYYRIGVHLASRGIPVPRFFWSEPENGLFLMEDVGDYHLQRHALKPWVDLKQLYRKAILLLIQLHGSAPAGFEASFCFDTPVYDAPFIYERELEYFRSAFLNGYLGMDIDAEALRSDFETLAEAAGAAGESQIIHRDFQSRNLMIHRGELRLIDFQGMRRGPFVYDLASLLIDPYVELPGYLQEDLAELYFASAGKYLNASRRKLRETYYAVRLCRNFQILGAYGFLGRVKGKKDFLRYIPSAWKQLVQWLAGPCRGRYLKLEEIVGRVEGNPGLARACRAS